MIEHSYFDTFFLFHHVINAWRFESNRGVRTKSLQGEKLQMIRYGLQQVGGGGGRAD